MIITLSSSCVTTLYFAWISFFNLRQKEHDK
uniref:Uncharacterized protein n=1 Tax=Rhizophora mucronata TaxID=61149 RepID=A0A2P2PIX5_RHIMU